ncbi:MAG TPA: hypothetical protein VJN01_01500, partial [Xanthomonadales bacterium]|nr:hypothetical protein [Xanthomonadales bacterium]
MNIANYSREIPVRAWRPFAFVFFYVGFRIISSRVFIGRPSPVSAPPFSSAGWYSRRTEMKFSTGVSAAQQTLRGSILILVMV